ncbi:hypothetical protein ES708_10058 [subsurface metagenome]
MAALLQLHEVKEEAEVAYDLVDEVIQHSEELEKTTQQAQYERGLAELTAQQAIKDQTRAEQAKSMEMRKRMLTTAQTMAIKATQVDKINIKALLAYQAYRFNEQYSGLKNHPDIYNGLYSVFAKVKGKDYNSFSGHEGAVRSLAFLPSRKTFFSSGADGKILRWDLERSSSQPQVLINNNFSNRSLAISSNGRWLACGTGTSTIQIFNLNQPNNQPQLKEGHRGSVMDLDFIRGKDILISIGSDKSIIYWNLLSGEKKTIVTHSTRIRTICASTDGKSVYGGTDDGKLIRWNISNGEARTVYDNKGNGIHAISINKNGSRIVMGDKPGNIIIVDLRSGKRISQVKGHTTRVLDISYSPDNTQIASSSFDGTIRIWNAGRLSESPVIITEHESWVFAIAFSRDGKTLVSSSEKGEVYYWPTRTKYMADEICRFVSRNFTDQEWDIYVGMDIEYQKTCRNLE